MVCAYRLAVLAGVPGDVYNLGRGRSVRIAEMVEYIQEVAQRHEIKIGTFGHAGDGNIHVNLMAAHYDDSAVRAKVERALDELFAQVLAWGGVITGEHGIGLAKKRWWPEATSEVSRALHARLKDALDPDDILNPGKFVG
jgi:glycolate oxidase